MFSMREGIEEIKKETQDDTGEYQAQANRLERDLLFGPSLPRSEVLKRTNALRSLPAPRQGIPEFFEAATTHEIANQYRAAFLAHLGKETQRLEKSATSLTPQETREIFSRWPERHALEEEEEKAIKSYEKATQQAWSGKRANALDARALLIDLMARRAQRVENPIEREKAQKEWANALEALIPMIEPAGRRHEYELLWLIREWVQEAKRDHVISVEHALPREDLAQGIDLVLTIGDSMFNIQMKEAAEDPYTHRHHEEMIEKTKAALVGKPIGTVVLSGANLTQAFQLETQGVTGIARARLTRLKNGLLTAFEAQIPGDQKELLWLAGAGEPKPDARERTKRFSQKDLERQTSVATLFAFGVLKPEDAKDPSRILAIKKRFLEAARGFIKAPEDLQNPSPEVVEKIQQAVSERPAA